MVGGEAHNRCCLLNDDNDSGIDNLLVLPLLQSTIPSSRLRAPACGLQGKMDSGGAGIWKADTVTTVITTKVRR